MPSVGNKIGSIKNIIDAAKRYGAGYGDALSIDPQISVKAYNGDAAGNTDFNQTGDTIVYVGDEFIFGVNRYGDDGRLVGR